MERGWAFGASLRSCGRATLAVLTLIVNTLNIRTLCLSYRSRQNPDLYQDVFVIIRQ